MGFMANIKGNKALKLHNQGLYEQARKEYDEAYKAGMDTPRLLLAYTVLLIRQKEFAKAKEILIKTQKAPGLTADQKTQIFVNYSVCASQLGELDKAVALLEKQHLHNPSGTIYETLGYLYVEKYDAVNKAAATGPDAVLPAGLLPDEGDEAEAELTEEEKAAKRQQALEEAWQKGCEKALAFNLEAVDYDDEDPISLDNLAQTYYRVFDNKAEAKKWFEKAIKVKEGQIDTLWYLSRYDLEEGNKKSAIARLEKTLDGRFSPLNHVTREQVEAEIERIKNEG